ncbi:MAG: chemotaxis protein CheW [Gemmatimonadota bacterium]|nr:chemotaxis protein CheW [Gemmatimonadota bacterium]
MKDDTSTVRESASDALARILARADSTPADESAMRKSVLEARARRLAKQLEHVEAGAADDEIDVLQFLVADEQLAIPLTAIVAIVRVGTITPLPRAVAPVFGVTAWRGRPLTVLSVGAHGQRGDVEDRLIVLGDGRRALVGLRADTADETQVVRKSALSPALGGARSVYAMGVTVDGVLVLDPDILIHSARPEL